MAGVPPARAADAEAVEDVIVHPASLDVVGLSYTRASQELN